MADSFIPDKQDSFQADSFTPDTPAPVAHYRSTPANTGMGAPVDFAVDALHGAAAGLMSTVYNGGDLIRRGLGMDRIINKPEIQAQITPPPTIGGKVGNVGESIAEFALPSGIVGKGVKALEAVSSGSKAARAGIAATKALGQAGAAGGTEFVRSGGDVSKSRTAALTAGATSAAEPIIGLAGKGLSEVLGKTTGAGGEAIRTAFNGASQGLKDAMRNKTSELQIVGDLKDAISTLAENRANAYRAQLSQLPTNITLDKAPVVQNILKELPKFRVNILSKTGQMDFSQSSLGSSASASDQSAMQDAVKTVMGWSDNSPMGFDALKRQLYKLKDSGVSGEAQAFINRVAGTVKQQLNDKVLGYSSMSKDYEEASNFISMVQKELSTTNENPGTIIRKLSYALNQNNQYRKMLLESVDNQAGSGLKDSIAGIHLKPLAPRGIAGALAGGAVAYSQHEPLALLGGLAVSSPRAVGETMALLSTLKRAVPVTAPAITTGAVMSSGFKGLTPPPAR